MNPLNKIYIIIFSWLAVTGICFYYIFPKISDNLVQLQSSHQDQIKENNNLNAQIQSIRTMQADLDQISKTKVTPADLFTSDVQLVNEIQHIESIAGLTNNALKITVSGTADDAAVFPGTSQLFQVPYSIILSGNFPGVVKFMHYFENSYFISPVTGVDVSSDPQAPTKVKAIILSNFLIHKAPKQ